VSDPGVTVESPSPPTQEILDELRDLTGTWPLLSGSRRSSLELVTTVLTFVGGTLSGLLVEEAAKAAARRLAAVVASLRARGDDRVEVVDVDSGLTFIYDAYPDPEAVRAMLHARGAGHPEGTVLRLHAESPRWVPDDGAAGGHGTT
jgi:hypothetical protein